MKLNNKKDISLGKFLVDNLGGELEVESERGNGRKDARIENLGEYNNRIIDEKIICFYTNRGFKKCNEKNNNELMFTNNNQNYLFISYIYSQSLRTLLISEMNV